MSDRNEGSDAPPAPVDDVLAEAVRNRAEARLVKAVVCAYQVLRSERGREPEIAAATHLFLSEVFSEMAYHGMARLHARETLRVAEQVSPGNPCVLAPRHLRLAAALREGGENALAEAQLMRANAASEACSDEATDTRAGIELESARLLAGRIGNAGEDHLSLLTAADEHIERSQPVGGDAGRPPAWAAEAFLLKAILLGEAWRAMPVALRLRTMLDSAVGLIDSALALIGNEPTLLGCRLLREKATIFRLQGKVVEAIDVLREDLDQSRRLQRMSTETVLGMVLCAGRIGSPANLGTLCSMMLERDLHALAEFGQFATEGDQLAYSERLRIRGDTCISLLVRHYREAPELRDRLFDFAVARKAVIADAERSFWQDLRGLEDPVVTAAGSTLAAEREELGARLAARNAEGAARRIDDIERRYQVLAHEPFWRSLRAEDSANRQQLERYLASLNETGSAWPAVEAAAPTRDSTPTGVQVAACLPTETVLVEILKVRDVDLESEKLGERADYWALVVTPGRSIDAIALGDAEEIDSAIARALEILRTGDIMDAASQDAALRDLADRIWVPLSSAVEQATRILICAEGAVCLCPFAALPAASGGFLVESKLVQQIVSARDLLPAQIERTDRPDRREEIVIVAGLDFGDPTTTAGDLGIKLDPLKESQKEAEAVRHAFPSSVSVVQVADATAAWFRGLAPPRILHIVTHGFVMAEPGPSAAQAHETDEDHWAAKSALARHVARLSRSGLALSDFHEERSGVRAEKMLSALAAGALDLRGTELVVLSACDSGLGQPAPSEGILGLPRAFRSAGASAVLMSLWKLHDREATSQMRVFYREFSGRGDPAFALAEAQRESVKFLRAAIGKAPPAIWAPLCVIGTPTIGSPPVTAPS